VADLTSEYETAVDKQKEKHAMSSDGTDFRNRHPESGNKHEVSHEKPE